jgi:hypothetical protein
MVVDVLEDGNVSVDHRTSQCITVSEQHFAAAQLMTLLRNTELEERTGIPWKL